MKHDPIIQQWGLKNHPIQKGGLVPRWLDLLHQRGLSAETVAHFGIRPQGHGWVYPVVHQQSVRRWKAFPGQPGAKYRWVPAQADDITFYDPLGNLAQHVAAANGVLILATGEADVWALHEGKIHHATATLHGEGHVPAWFVAELHRLEVTQVMLYPDCDATGLRYAEKVRQALAGTEISLDIRALPYAPDSKGDIGKLLVEVGPENLYKTLTICPPLELPTLPRIIPAHQPINLPGPAHDASALEEIERRVRAEIARALVKRGRKEGYYHCPFEDHGADGKDFLFNAEPGEPIGGCQGKHAGQLTRWVDLAEFLKIDVRQIARDVAEERRPARAARPRPVASEASYASRFVYGPPETLIKRTLQLSRLVKVEKQTPAAYGLVLWDELRNHIGDDVWFSRGAFQEACNQIGRSPSDDTVKTLLLQEVGLGSAEHLRVIKIEKVESESGSGDFYNLYTQSGEIYRLQKCALADNMTSTRDLYRFLPVAEQLENFSQLYYRALREYAFKHAPDNAQPEWGDLSAEQAQDWDDFRAPAYLHYAEQRERAIQQLERDLGFLEGDLERIEAGRYRVVTLPPGFIRNSADFRAAFKRYLVQVNGGEMENDYKTARMLGVERSSLARINERAGVIKVARTKVIAVDDLTQYQRDYLVERWHPDGTATVKLPSAAKLREAATPEEIAAYDELRSAQRDRRLSPVVPEAPSENNSSPAPRCRKTPVLPLVMWQGYSEEYKRRQYDYAPLPPDFSTFDPDTGELYTADQLWQRGAEYLRSKRPAEKETPNTTSETQNPVALPADAIRETDHHTGAGIGCSGDGLAPGDNPGPPGRLA